MTAAKPLRILIADDEEIVRHTLGHYLRELGHEIDEAMDGVQALKKIDKGDYDLALVDVRMPGMDGLTLLGKIRDLNSDTSVVIITAHGNMEMTIKALRLGAADFITKPVKLFELDAVVEKSLRVRSLQQQARRLHETIGGLQSLDQIRTGNRHFIGASAETDRVTEQIKRIVAAGCDSILITGETGTGKEIVAREIHFSAGPNDSPFIAVSCPALPDTLVESELFGHMKGSFTGASADRAGYFELADGGTLFLDEVGDLSAPAQATLLRVLETRTLRRVGGSKEITVNVRVIAATNAPLDQFIEKGKFRQDLYYRLNTYAIHLSPLRERREDILPLARHFLTSYSLSRGLKFEGISKEAEQVLLNYDYPGNARELRNMVERAAILSLSGRIEPEHLYLPPGSTDRTKPALGPEAAEKKPSPVSGGEERDRILAALESTRWNRRQAARELGMPYSTFRFKMQKYNIR